MPSSPRQRTLACRAAALVLLPCLASAASEPGRADAPPPRVVPVSWTEAGGLRVVVAGSELGAAAGPPRAMLFVRAGTELDDPMGAAGLAEMTAATVVQGSTTRAWRDLQTELKRLHASLNALVASDYVILDLAVPDAAGFSEALALVQDLVTHPAFEPTSLDAACASMTQDLLSLRTAPVEMARRLAPGVALPAGAPGSTQLPDPWSLRATVAMRVRDFHRQHYVPDGSVLAVSGLTEEAARAAVASSFATWTGPGQARRDVVPPAPVAAAAAVEPAPARIGVAPVQGGTAVAIALRGGAGEGSPLARHAVATLLADSLGHPAAAGAPFPASGIDMLVLPASSASAATALLARARAGLARLASDGPTAEELGRYRSRLAAGQAASLARDGFPAYWAGLSAFRGLPWDLQAAAVTITPEEIARQARALVGQGSPCAVIACPPKGVRSLLRREEAVLLDPFRVAAGTASAEARGRRILEAALKAQGDPARIRAIRNIDERTEGMFHGIGTHVAVRTRTVITLPDRAYLESVMYNHDRFIANRLINGEIWVDRSTLGTHQEQRFDKARLLARQILLHPSVALARAERVALIRLASAENEDDPTRARDVLDVLDPVAGRCRFGIRRSDRALVRIELDLAPLDASVEAHEFDDFRVVEGVRVPFTDSATASGRPLKDTRVESITFPAELDQAMYLTPASPDPSVFSRPGPPDGKPTPPGE